MTDNSDKLKFPDWTVRRFVETKEPLPISEVNKLLAEISRLQAEVARPAQIEAWRVALDIIAYDPPGYDECIDIARQALTAAAEVGERKKFVMGVFANPPAQERLPAQIEAAKALKFLCEEITDREGREGMTDFDFAEQVIALAQSMKPKAEAALTAAAEVGRPERRREFHKAITFAAKEVKEITIERCAEVARLELIALGRGPAVDAVMARIRALKERP